MSIGQVNYESESLVVKRVKFDEAETETIVAGELVCYDRASGTAENREPGRFMNVKRPVTANLTAFAGVVTQGSNGKKGGDMIEIMSPVGRKAIVDMLVTGAVVVNTTAVNIANGVNNGTTAAGTQIGKAMQTDSDTGVKMVQVLIEELSEF